MRCRGLESRRRGGGRQKGVHCQHSDERRDWRVEDKGLNKAQGYMHKRHAINAFGCGIGVCAVHEVW